MTYNTTDPAMERELTKLEQEWAAAVEKGNVAVLDRIIADTFVGTTPDGRVESKAEYLEQYRASDLKVSSVKASELRVSVYGDCAIVIGRSAIQGMRGARPIDAQRRWTDVFVREGGTWRCVAAQACKL